MRETGYLFIKPLYGRRKLQNNITFTQRFCVLTEKLFHISNPLTVLYHNLSVSKSTSVYYNIAFTVDAPSNSELFRLNFIPSGDYGYKENNTSCEKKHSTSPYIDTLSNSRLVPNVLGHDTSTLSVSIGNVWSGCHIENRHGRPTYRCTGGWSFISDSTISVTLATCHDLDWTLLYINYTLEFYGPFVNAEDCSSASACTVFGTVTNLVIWSVITLCILMNYRY